MVYEAKENAPIIYQVTNEDDNLARTIYSAHVAITELFILSNPSEYQQNKFIDGTSSTPQCYEHWLHFLDKFAR